jgi:hypothetical protein
MTASNVSAASRISATRFMVGLAPLAAAIPALTRARARRSELAAADLCRPGMQQQCSPPAEPWACSRLTAGAGRGAGDRRGALAAGGTAADGCKIAVRVAPRERAAAFASGMPLQRDARETGGGRAALDAKAGRSFRDGAARPDQRLLRKAGVLRLDPARAAATRAGGAGVASAHIRRPPRCVRLRGEGACLRGGAARNEQRRRRLNEQWWAAAQYSQPAPEPTSPASHARPSIEPIAPALTHCPPRRARSASTGPAFEPAAPAPPHMAALLSKKIVLAMSAAVEKPVAQALQQVLRRAKDASERASRAAPVRAEPAGRLSELAARGRAADSHSPPPPPPAPPPRPRGSGGATHPPRTGGGGA